MSSILITSTPDGEAPLEIREAWVGTILPISNRRRTPLVSQVVGVLSGPKTYLQLVWSIVTRRYVSENWNGFHVFGAEALIALEKRDPDAAMWWRENAPHAFKKGTILVFPADCCEVIPKGGLQ